MKRLNLCVEESPDVYTVYYIIDNKLRNIWADQSIDRLINWDRNWDNWWRSRGLSVSVGALCSYNLMQNANEPNDTEEAEGIDYQEVKEDIAPLELNNGDQHAAKSRLRHLDHTHHALIIEARSLGKSMKEIALTMHRSEHQIRRICKNHDKNGHLGRQLGSGRKRKTSTQEDDIILEEASKQRKNTSANSLYKLLGLKNISERTVRRRIKEHTVVQATNSETWLSYNHDACRIGLQ